MSYSAPDDAQLVVASLSGNRDAFGHIVSRYQSLICSLAYCATGNLAESEDLAQETFITAWKHLGHLREQHKLRAWLCGIARNCIKSALRREGRQPPRSAEELDAVQETAASAEPLPYDQTISNEEAALLWRSIERIPEIYREPLVLFYREQQSIESVATALELSEDAVKQRLSRGRKLLADEVATFVEGALSRTNPGRAFTVAVLAALPAALATSAKAVTLGAAAKGGLATKTALGTGLFSALIGPLMSIIGPWMQYQILLTAGTTEEERRKIKRCYRQFLAVGLGFGLCLTALIAFGRKFVDVHPLAFASCLIVLAMVFVAALVWMGVRTKLMFLKLQQNQNVLAATSRIWPAWEFKSRARLLGLPLFHFCFNSSGKEQRMVKAWIAGGDFACGILFAFGGIAIAPISIGVGALGLISLGAGSLGLFTIGGFAVGCWAMGGLALGWQACGGCALAVHAAMGGFALAREFALGGAAHAAQANNKMASQYIHGNKFFQWMMVLSRHIVWVNLVWIFPILWRKVIIARQSTQA